MKTFRIELLTRVGEFFFGMAREDARKILGEYSEFKKSKFSKNTSDDYKICHIYYDTQNKVEAIEFFRDMDVELELNNIALFEREYIDLANYVKGFDAGVEIKSDGFVSKKGISVYAPSGKTETILLTSENYWQD